MLSCIRQSAAVKHGEDIGTRRGNLWKSVPVPPLRPMGQLLHPHASDFSHQL
jgi:hypothetical protein